MLYRRLCFTSFACLFFASGCTYRFAYDVVDPQVQELQSVRGSGDIYVTPLVFSFEPEDLWGFKRETWDEMVDERVTQFTPQVIRAIENRGGKAYPLEGEASAPPDALVVSTELVDAQKEKPGIMRGRVVVTRGSDTLFDGFIEVLPTLGKHASKKHPEKSVAIGYRPRIQFGSYNLAFAVGDLVAGKGDPGGKREL